MRTIFGRSVQLDAIRLDHRYNGPCEKERETMMSLAIFLSLLLFYSLISQQLERTILTAPIVFTIAGMLVFTAFPWILDPGTNEEVLFRLAEIGLVLLLFTDASRTDLKLLRRIGNLPARLLSVGMLLTIFFGAVVHQCKRRSSSVRSSIQQSPLPGASVPNRKQ